MGSDSQNGIGICRNGCVIYPTRWDYGIIFRMNKQSGRLDQMNHSVAAKILIIRMFTLVSKVYNNYFSVKMKGVGRGFKFFYYLSKINIILIFESLHYFFILSMNLKRQFFYPTTCLQYLRNYFWLVQHIQETQ